MAHAGQEPDRPRPVVVDAWSIPQRRSKVKGHDKVFLTSGAAISSMGVPFVFTDHEKIAVDRLLVES